MSHLNGLDAFTGKQWLFISLVVPVFSSTTDNVIFPRIPGEAKKTIHSIWETIQEMDSDVAQMDEISIIRQIVELSCPSLTPEATQEIVDAITQVINRK